MSGDNRTLNIRRYGGEPDSEAELTEGFAMSGKSTGNKKKTKADKKEDINFWHVESIGRRGARKMKIEGELAGVCEPEKLRAEMLAAVSKNEDISGKMTRMQAAFSTAPVGKVYVYREKGEIKAVCIFAIDEREVPVSAAEVKESEMTAKRKIDGGELKEFLDDKDRETVMVDSATLDDETVYELRKCYVKKALYIIPSYEEHRDSLTGLFRRQIEESMSISDVEAYSWDDELVMANMIKENGRYVSVLSMGIGVGTCFGMCIGMALDNMAVGICFGIAVGAALSCGTTTITNYKQGR